MSNKAKKKQNKITSFTYNKGENPLGYFGDPDVHLADIEPHHTQKVTIKNTNDMKAKVVSLEKEAEKASDCEAFEKAQEMQDEADKMKEDILFHDKLYKKCVSLKLKASTAVAKFKSDRKYLEAGKWKNLLEKVGDLLEKSENREEEEEQVVAQTIAQGVATATATASTNMNDRTEEEEEDGDGGDGGDDGDDDDDSTEGEVYIDGLFRTATPSKNGAKKRKIRTYDSSSKERRAPSGYSKRDEKTVVTKAKLEAKIKKQGLEGHRIEYLEGDVVCRACSNKISWSNITQHCKTKRHLKYVETLNKKEKETDQYVQMTTLLE